MSRSPVWPSHEPGASPGRGSRADEFAPGPRSKAANTTAKESAMGTLVVTEFVSVDGVFEDPGGAENYEHGGWTFEYNPGEDGNPFQLDELTEAKVHLLGRVTYEGFAAAWPSRDGPFADKLNNDPKVVVSTTLEDPTWENTTVVSGDVVGEVSKLKEKTDGVVLVAGSG